MNKTGSAATLFGLFAVCLVTLGVFATSADAQTRRRKRVVKQPVVITPTPQTRTEPLIISRAEDFPDENSPQLVSVPVANEPAKPVEDDNSRSIEELRARLASLENIKSKDSDQKQKKLLLYLDILTKAEQRAESLRKQVFEMIEKESATKSRLDGIDTDVRPESIEKNVALAGTLRPEELRDARRRSLVAERTNLQNLLTEIQKTRAALEANLVKADALVERMRSRLEKDIDDALADDPEEKP